MPPPPRTSPRRRSSPRSGRSTASIAAVPSRRGCTGSSSTARSTGRGAGSLRAEVGGDALAAEAAPERDADPGLLESLAGLSPDHRAVIVLRYLLEYTPGEIAKLLDLPRGTVNSRLRRGLDQLKGRAS